MKVVVLDSTPLWLLVGPPNPPGTACTTWADGLLAGGAALGFCLESTGAYGEALATALADADRHVAVVNPARVKYAGLMRGQGNKQDRPRRCQAYRRVRHPRTPGRVAPAHRRSPGAAGLIAAA